MKVKCERIDKYKYFFDPFLIKDTSAKYLLHRAVRSWPCNHLRL
ncbi:hypothetical protein Lser_V15G21520 [Lactuca serriola]